MKRVLMSVEPRHNQPGVNKVDLLRFTLEGSHYSREMASVVIAGGKFKPASREFRMVPIPPKRRRRLTVKARRKVENV